MRLKAAVSLIFLVLALGVKAQRADKQIKSILNSGDWFALEEKLPEVRNKIRSIAVKSISETILLICTNQPQKALLLIDSVLAYYENRLVFEDLADLVLFKNEILFDQGYYAESANGLNDFIKKASERYPSKNIPLRMVADAKYFNQLRSIPKSEIIRPGKDTEIPMRIEKAGKDVLMSIPVTIKGKIYHFIFDTGAVSSFVSERLAKIIGLRTVVDSVQILGVGAGMGRKGIIDSMAIGGILFKNPIITIAPVNPDVDTVYKIDGILGLDFIKRIGETRIFPQQGKILFPQNETQLPQTGRNLLIGLNGHPYLKAFSGDEELVFHFDTGNGAGDLYAPYYLKHKKQIERQGTKDTLRAGGVGGVRRITGYRLSDFPLKVGAVDFVLSDMFASPDARFDFQQQEDGALGMSFIKSFQKVTINFTKMFVEAER